VERTKLTFHLFIPTVDVSLPIGDGAILCRHSTLMGDSLLVVL